MKIGVIYYSDSLIEREDNYRGIINREVDTNIIYNRLKLFWDNIYHII